MAKFKVGDRVRVIENESGHGLQIGDVFTVQIDEDGDATNGEWYFYDSDLEPAPKFAVGDRVRFTDKCRPAWWFGPHTEHKEGVISTVNEKSYRYEVTVDCSSFPAYVDDEHIALAAPAPQPPLTIRAGRYDKTRGGRKVGPMRVERGGDVWKWNVASPRYIDGMRAAWRADGGFEYSGSSHPADLIAEWVDEPVAAVARTGKFKVGDRVAFVDNYGSDAAGKEATVIKVNVWGDGKGIQVDQGGGISTEHAHSLRLVAPATSGKRETYTLRDARFFVSDGDGGWHQIAGKRPAIVALIENGQPRPSANPSVHPDREAATKEAKRLAGKHKGQEFGVYELVDTAKVEPNYEYGWQNLAASGRKIEAIKRVREATGFTLKGAKDAVEHWLELNAV